MGALVMAPKAGRVREIVECGIGARTLSSETHSGDRAVIAPFRSGVVVAAVDGLGHGREAADAAAAAASVIQDCAGEPLERLVSRCHGQLRKTRGVALSLASLDAENHAMTWLGVGNVEGLLFRSNEMAPRARECLLLRGGIVGYQMGPLRSATLPIRPGDTLIFATDGVDREFSSESPLGHLPQEFADEIIARYGKASDDALVLVARYVGDPA